MSIALDTAAPLDAKAAAAEARYAQATQLQLTWWRWPAW
jgi:hypothetical protein